MSTKRVLTIVLIASAVLLAAGIGPQVANTALALPPAQAGVTIPYSGSLADEAGQPVADGAYAFTFALYDAETRGSPLWTEAQEGVAVQDGAFTALLGSVTPLPKEVLDDGARWLEVAVRGPGEAGFTALTPRQELSAAASVAQAGLAAPAKGLSSSCAHTHFGEYWTGSASTYALRLANSGGSAFAANTSVSGGIGVYGGATNSTGTGTGVRGYSYSPAGYGGYFYNDYGGTGLYASGTGGVGVSANSSGNDGVAGSSAASNKSGVYGYNSAAGGGFGVYGVSNSGRGVQGVDGGPDPDNSFGVYSQGDIYTTDDLVVMDTLFVGGLATFSGGKSGYVVEIAQNDDTVALEVGDIVVISGAGPAVVGEIPVIKVRRAMTGETSAVVGVVDQLYVPAPANSEAVANGEIKAESIVSNASIAPGQYMTIVTLGAFKAIKVDASYGAINPGDLLVASPNPGYAMRAPASPKPGTIIGKALGALSSGTGVIPVMVTLH